MTIRTFLILGLVALIFAPTLAQATNQGDFAGGVAIGSSYAGVDSAPANGLIVQGAVGIGTTTPNSELQVNGEAQVGSSGNSCTSSTAGAIRYSSGTLTYCNGTNYVGPTAAAAGSTGDVQFNNSGALGANSNLFWDNTNDRLGIGTSSPGYTLDVDGTVNIQGSNGYVRLTSSSGGGSSSDYWIGRGGVFGTPGATLALYSPSSTGSGVELGVANQAVLVINSSGDVGIGDLRPVDMLDVAGSIGLTTTTSVTVPTNGIYLPSANQLAVTTSGARALTITSTGSVGIGITSPQGLTQLKSSSNIDLLLAGPVAVSGAFSINAINDAATANIPLELRSSFTDFSTGDVGIGMTTSPGAALEVNGEVKVDTFGSATATTVCENGGILSSCSSSMRYKEKVEPATFGLDDVMAMRPVTFKWKGRDENDFGLIAEDVAKINPLFVTYKNGEIEGVKYNQLTAVLIKAVQEENNRIDQLQHEIVELRRSLAQ